jgi:hypothetical protein
MAVNGLLQMRKGCGALAVHMGAPAFRRPRKLGAAVTAIPKPSPEASYQLALSSHNTGQAKHSRSQPDQSSCQTSNTMASSLQLSSASWRSRCKAVRVRLASTSSLC